jgi:hypothetical protein
MSAKTLPKRAFLTKTCFLRGPVTITDSNRYHPWQPGPGPTKLTFEKRFTPSFSNLAQVTLAFAGTAFRGDDVMTPTRRKHRQMSQSVTVHNKLAAPLVSDHQKTNCVDERPAKEPNDSATDPKLHREPVSRPKPGLPALGPACEHVSLPRPGFGFAGGPEP